jgi:hypothetical protein
VQGTSNPSETMSKDSTTGECAIRTGLICPRITTA